MAKGKSFEASIEELEKIVEALEKGECNLDDAVKLFENGVKLSKECHEALDKAEQKIKILTEDDTPDKTGEDE